MSDALFTFPFVKSTRTWFTHSSSRPSVILDLDNTLICASITVPRAWDFAFDFVDGGHPVTIYVTLRPFLQNFLDSLRELADLYLFSAGTASYVRHILSHIDPFGVIFRRVFTREDCTQVARDKFVKNYEKCGTNMEQTFVVDDNPAYFGKWAPNGFAIQPFVGEPGDLELIRVLHAIQSKWKAMGFF
jgi:Dullard-like phosphatase family protein